MNPLNVVLDAVKGERSLHVCHYDSQTILPVLWDRLLPWLNKLHVDHLVLEFARSDYSHLEMLKGLRDDIALGIGVIDIKDNEVESPDEVARGIEKAVSVLGKDRIKWIHPDCGFFQLPRSVADRKMRALVLGRDQFLGINQ